MEQLFLTLYSFDSSLCSHETARFMTFKDLIRSIWKKSRARLNALTRVTGYMYADKTYYECFPSVSVCLLSYNIDVSQ